MGRQEGHGANSIIKRCHLGRWNRGAVLFSGVLGFTLQRFKLGPKSQHDKSQSSAQLFHCMMRLCSLRLKPGDWQRSLQNTLMTLQASSEVALPTTRSPSAGLSKRGQIRMLPKENQQSNENFPQNWKNMHKIFNGKLLFHHLKCFLYIYSSLPIFFFF